MKSLNIRHKYIVIIGVILISFFIYDTSSTKVFAFSFNFSIPNSPSDNYSGAGEWRGVPPSKAALDDFFGEGKWHDLREVRNGVELWMWNTDWDNRGLVWECWWTNCAVWRKLEGGFVEWWDWRFNTSWNTELSKGGGWKWGVGT